MNINFSGVSKIFEPDIAALVDINIDIKQGEFVYVIGQTGSGKSTLLRFKTHKYKCEECGHYFNANPAGK